MNYDGNVVKRKNDLVVNEWKRNTVDNEDPRNSNEKQNEEIKKKTEET